VTQLSDVGGKVFVVSVEVETDSYYLGNVSGVYWAAVDYLQTAGFFQGEEGEIVLACKIPINKGKTRCATVYQGVCFELAVGIYEGALENQMTAIELIFWDPPRHRHLRHTHHRPTLGLLWYKGNRKRNDRDNGNNRTRTRKRQRRNGVPDEGANLLSSGH
jgi:hypothetical protein